MSLRALFVTATGLFGATIGGALCGAAPLGFVAGFAAGVAGVVVAIALAVGIVWVEYQKGGLSSLSSLERDPTTRELATLMLAMVTAATLTGLHHGSPVTGLVAGVVSVGMRLSVRSLWRAASGKP